MATERRAKLRGVELPLATEAERTILGAVLCEPMLLASVCATMTPADFFGTGHRSIYEAMVDLVSHGKTVDLVTVKDVLGSDVEKCGGVSYLAGLVDGVPRVLNVEGWAKIVHGAAVRRRLMHAGGRVISLAAEVKDECEASDLAVRAIATASEGTAVDPMGDPGKDLKAGLALLERMKNGGTLGVCTGLLDLDKRLSGLQRGQLIVIGGRPGQGKTSLALTIAEHVASQKIPVLFFSLEMRREEIAARRLCAEIGVSSRKLAEKDWATLSKALGDMLSRPLYVDDSAQQRVPRIQARARHTATMLGHVGLVVVDYMQLVTGADTENRQQEVSSVSRALKVLAKELDVPVLALSQLRRPAEGQGKARPILSDLRESGAIEQDADTVVFIHRPEEYGDKEKAGLAELIVAKQRNGPTGIVNVRFDQDLTRFYSLAQPHDEPYA